MDQHQGGRRRTVFSSSWIQRPSAHPESSSITIRPKWSCRRNPRRPWVRLASRVPSLCWLPPRRNSIRRVRDRPRSVEWFTSCGSDITGISNLYFTGISNLYTTLAMRAMGALAADTSLPYSSPPLRMGPAIASSSGTRPATTSFCIELRKASGAPSSAARIGSGATWAPSATPTAQASLTHPSRRVHHMASERTAPSEPPKLSLPELTAPENRACPKAS
jgi:hypothetical protein